MKMQMMLMSCMALLLTSCGKSNENEYAVARLADMITVYWVLPAHAEIANFELTDNVLELEVDMGDLAEKNGRRILEKQGTLYSDRRVAGVVIFSNCRKPGNA